MLTRKRTLFAKIEGTYGVDPVLAGTDAVQTKNLTISPLEGTVEPLDFDGPVLGTSQSIHIGSHVVVEFDVPFAGNATAAGTAPPYDALLEACGLDGIADAGVNYEYLPDSESTSSVWLEVELDGTQHQVSGARGTVSFNLTAGAVPFWHFRFLGLYNAPAAVADTTPDVSDYITVIPVTSTNTPTVSIHGQAFDMASLQWDLNNELVFNELAAGSQEILIVNRAPAAQIDVKSLAIGTFNAVAVALANTQSTVSIIHGIVAANIWTLTANYVQLLNPAYSDANGIRNWSMGLQFNRTTTDNDFALTHS